MNEKPEIITLEEAAKLTRYNLKYLNNHYTHLFTEQGVRILRISPNARPRFYRKEILAMMEACK